MQVLTINVMFLIISGRQRKRQPPPVPRKPDSSTRRTAVSPNDQLDGTDQESCANQSNNGMGVILTQNFILPSV